MHRIGVLNVPEQLTGSCSGDVSPGSGTVRVCKGGAPSLLHRAHGGAIAPCEDREPQVGKDEAATALYNVVDDETQACEPLQKLGDPRPLHLQHPTQVSGRHPGPVGEQVEAALLRRFEQRRQQVVGCGVVLPVHLEVFGEGDPLGRLLGRQLSAGFGVLQGPTEVEGYPARGYAPYGRGWVCRHSVPLKGEERSGRRSCQQPPRLSEAHLVGEAGQGWRWATGRPAASTSARRRPSYRR